jgi:hypothetical protein
MGPSYWVKRHKAVTKFTHIDLGKFPALYTTLQGVRIAPVGTFPPVGIRPALACFCGPFGKAPLALVMPYTLTLDGPQDNLLNKVVRVKHAVGHGALQIISVVNNSYAATASAIGRRNSPMAAAIFRQHPAQEVPPSLI